MSEALNAEGYQQTKEKLHDLETRLAQIETRTDLHPHHQESVRRSYKMMMREMLREIRLYEVRQMKKEALRLAK
jgi:hypothetical protein